VPDKTTIEVYIMFTKRVLTVSTLAGIAALTAACGGGSGSNTSTSTSDSGTFSLAVTDGPVDSAQHVVVEFDGVSIQPVDGEVIEFLFDTPKSLDLLALQGSLSEPLVAGESVPAGDYEWIRLHVNATRDGVMDSYIDIDGSRLELYVPSGAETGLKLVSGFTVAAGGAADFTIDFDLRKSVTNPPGMADAAILRPALRLVNNMVVGSVAGTVDSTLVSQQCADASLDDGAVYIFAGAGATPTDIQGLDSDPLVTALVHYETSYTYEIGFLAEGDYTVAYTCNAGSDDPAVANELAFVGAATVSVTAGSQTTHDFVAAEEVATDETTTQ
jgi:hypothetical protein